MINIETGSGVAVLTTGGGSEENVSLPAALKGARKPEPFFTKDGTTDESATEKACVVGLMNCTNAELYTTDPAGGVEAEKLALVPPLFPESVAFAPGEIVPESRFV